MRVSERLSVKEKKWLMKVRGEEASWARKASGGKRAKPMGHRRLGGA